MGVDKQEKHDKKRTVEITVSLGAVIPTGQYENIQPSYQAKESIEVDGDAEDVIRKKLDFLRSIISQKIDQDYARIRNESIRKKLDKIRFTERNGILYPHVTSIIECLDPIKFDPDKLKQYVSRGNLVHAQIDHFFRTGIMEEDFDDIPGTKLDKMIVEQGSEHLDYKKPSFKNFWEKYKSRIYPMGNEMKVYNDKELYCGSLDLYCIYDNVYCIFDFKTASTYDKKKLERYWKQLSAYAKCVDGVKQMVIIPLNPKKEAGFGEPIVCDEVDKYFNLFMQDRDAVRKMYNI